MSTQTLQIPHWIQSSSVLSKHNVQVVLSWCRLWFSFSQFVPFLTSFETKFLLFFLTSFPETRLLPFLQESCSECKFFPRLTDSTLISSFLFQHLFVWRTCVYFTFSAIRRRALARLKHQELAIILQLPP